MLHAAMASVSLAMLRTQLMEQLRATAGGLPRTYWYLWAGTLLNRLGTFVVPFLTLYLTRERGFSVAQAGLVVSLHGAGAVAAGLVGGALADRVGRRTALVLGLWLGSAGMLFLGFSRDPAFITIAAFMLGVTGEMYRPAVSAAITDVVPPQDRSRAFGLLYWVINVGFAIALPLAGLVAQGGFLLLFVADAITTFLYGCLVWIKVPETRPERPQARSLRPSTAPFQDPVFLAFGVPSFLLALIFFQSHVTLPLAMGAHGMSMSEFGLAMSLNGTLIVLVQPFCGRLISRMRRATALALATTLTGIGFGLHALSFNVPLAMLAVAVWTMGEILQAPVAPTVVADLAPAELRGSYQGAYHMVWGLAAFTAPALGGWVLDRHGSHVLWGGCLVLGLLASAWHLAIAGARRRHLAALRAKHPEVGVD